MKQLLSSIQELSQSLQSDFRSLTSCILQTSVVSDEKKAKKQAFTSDALQLLTLQRCREFSRKAHIPGANHLLRRSMTAIYGCEIGNDVSLGKGVYFVHPVSIVIGGDAVIGDRVKFMGNNTVGTAKENGYPVIENDVIVGAGARILGPIRVGAGSVIGANAVVVKDVPKNSIVMGIPGKVVGKTKEVEIK